MEFLKSRVYCSQTQLGEVKWGEVSNLDSIMPCPSMGPKLFWTIQIVLVRPNLFPLDQNNVGQVQVIEISPEKSNLNLESQSNKQIRCK